MNGLAAIMLLVSCDDSYGYCHAQNDATSYYQTVDACENALLKKVEALSHRGQQIMGKCIKVESHTTSPIVHWNVNKEGDLYTAISDQPTKKSLSHKL